LAKFAPNATANITKGPFTFKGTAAPVVVLLLAAPVAVLLLDTEEGPVGTE
jgi:hypothetical protein